MPSGRIYVRYEFLFPTLNLLVVHIFNIIKSVSYPFASSRIALQFHMLINICEKYPHDMEDENAAHTHSVIPHFIQLSFQKC